MVILAVLRHAEAVQSATGYLHDEERVLTPAGRRQAVALRPAIARFRPDRVWYSDQRRAAETWALACPAAPLPATPDPGLGERRMRSLEGLSLTQIADRLGPERTRLAQAQRGLADVPGEESVRQASERVVASVARIVAAATETGAERLLIVSHGGPSSWLLCHLLRLSVEQCVLFRHAPARFHVVRLDKAAPGGLRLLRVGVLNGTGIDLDC